MVTQFLDKVLVENWRQAWKFYTIWFYALLAALPEIVALAAQHGIIDPAQGDVPSLVTKLIQWIAFAGAMSRIIKQLKPELPAKEEAAA